MLHLKVFNYLEDVYDVLFMELRKQDKKEIKDFLDKEPQEALSDIINNNEVMFLIKDELEKVVGIYGTKRNKDIETAGEMFFLATDELKGADKFQFMRYSKDIVREVMDMEEYLVLYNYVSSENKGSIKWLKWMGFEVFEDKEVFFENPKVPFYFFKLERS